jgi:hypothetical protein
MYSIRRVYLLEELDQLRNEAKEIERRRGKVEAQIQSQRNILASVGARDEGSQPAESLRDHWLMQLETRLRRALLITLLYQRLGIIGESNLGGITVSDICG